MASLVRIPERLQRRLVDLAKIPQSSFDAFIRAMRESGGAAFASKDAARKVASKISGIAPEDAFGYIEAVLPLYFLKGSTGKESEELSQDVVYSLETLAKPDKQPSRKDVNLLRARLVKLFEVDSVQRVAKATALRREAEHILSDLRVISDIRPIFDDVDEEPTAAIVTHTLKIEFLNNGEEKQLFLALDDEDLKRLSDIASRALKKDARLKELLSKAQIHYVSIESED